MDSFYPPHPNQSYNITLHGRSQGTSPNNNMKPPTPVGLDQFVLDDRYPELVDDSTIDASQWNSPYNVHTTSALTKVQGALKEYGCYSRPGMYLNDQPWPALNNYDTDSNSLHRMTSPYPAHAISDSVSITQWTPNEDLTAQLSSTHFTPVVSQPDSIAMQGTQLPGTAVDSVTQQLSHLRYAGNAPYAEQKQKQIYKARISIHKVDDAVARIGSVLSNGKFVCDAEGCESKTFARQAELRRHHTTLHAANKPNFWCQVPNCRRSMNSGGEAFHRKDKLAAHVRSIHSDVQQVYP